MTMCALSIRFVNCIFFLGEAFVSQTESRELCCSSKSKIRSDKKLSHKTSNKLGAHKEMI